MRFPSRAGSTIRQTMVCCTLSPCSRPCSTSPMSGLFWHSVGARLRRNCSHFVTIGCAWRCKGSFLCVLVRSDVCYKLYYSTQDNHRSRKSGQLRPMLITLLAASGSAAEITIARIHARYDICRSHPREASHPPGESFLYTSARRDL